MRCTTLLALLTGVMLYLVMGALVFRTLETPKESLAFQELLATKRAFLQNKTCVTERDFQKLLKGLVSAVEAGLDVSGLDISKLPANFTTRWDLASAFFFCGTIITTIGFGNLSPRTWYGQLFCVCYALVGIPMFGILLAGVGDHMGTVLRRAVAKIETLFLKREVRPTTVRVISAVLSILIGCLIFLAVPTVVFQKVEDWTFLEALYFVVITLTTVGFGDYVPGGGRDGGMFFKPLVWFWIVFGLAYFASILTMIGNWLRVLSKRTRAEMEELRAHATDWTQNIQNMSMDFRIPNPLEFNDPFLLQRRRWKRSGRRRIRRGAQGTLGHLARGGSENGHLPNNRWAALSNSVNQLDAHHSSLERAAAAAMVTKTRVPVRSGAGTMPRAGPGLSLDPAVRLQVEGRLFPHMLSRSFSLPVAHSTLKMDSAGHDAMQGGRGEFLPGSDESPSDSRSDCSSVSSTFMALPRFQHCCTASSMDEGSARPTHKSTALAIKRKIIPAENCGSVVSNDSHMGLQNLTPPGLLPCATPHTQFPSAVRPILLPSHPLNIASASACQLLDYFGENLAYIDESSDTLSDRAGQSGGFEEKRRRPRKPKRRSMRRQLPHRWSPVQLRRPSGDMQPPSNPPTPPPPTDSSLSDLPQSENHTGSDSNNHTDNNNMVPKSRCDGSK